MTRISPLGPVTRTFPRFGTVELISGPVLDRAHQKAKARRPFWQFVVDAAVKLTCPGSSGSLEDAVDEVVLNYAKQHDRPEPHTVLLTEFPSPSMIAEDLHHSRLLITGEADNALYTHELPLGRSKALGTLPRTSEIPVHEMQAMATIQFNQHWAKTHGETVLLA